MVRLQLGEGQSGMQKTGMASTADLELIARVLDSLSPFRLARLGADAAGPVLDQMLDAADGGLGGLVAPSLDPAFEWPECLGTDSAWWGHVPFASWLVTTLRPRCLVELGSWYGVSYFTFCQAVLAADLACRCHAVDTWEGDPHAGIYGPEVHAEFARFNDALYASISTIHRMTFDEAAAGFAEGSVDLLHIDGLHTYEAVRHDFEAWLPKMSACGVILFHDVTERREDFGVWRLWEELSAKWPSFLFPHSHGLGVLCVGPEVAPALRALCTTQPPEAERVRQRFGLIGRRWQAENELRILRNRLVAEQAEMRILRNRLVAEQAELRQLQDEASRLGHQEERLRQIEQSSTWRATAPVRGALRRFPSVAAFGRKSLRVIWWGVTLQLPARLAQRRAARAATKHEG
jgi:hypothetical protein